MPTIASDSRSDAARLLSNPAFVRWLLSDTVSTLGTGISTVVLPVIVYNRTESSTLTGAVFGVRVVPYLLFGLIAGTIADRVDRKRLVVWGIVGEGVALASIPIVAIFVQVPIWQIFAATLIGSTCFVFSDAATFGALPSLLGKDLLPAANGMLTAAASAALVAGPAVGSLLASWVGAEQAVWFTAGAFVLAAGLIATIRAPFRSAASTTTDLRLVEHARAGLRFVWRHRVIRTLVAAGAINSLAFGALIGQLVVYADRVLGVPGESTRLGVLFAAGAVGTLLAGASFGRLYSRERIAVLTPSALVGAGIVAVVFGATSTYLVALVLYVAFSWCVQTVISTGITYRQTASPDELVSSVNVVGRMVAWGGQPLGALLGGVVADGAGVRWMCLAAAAAFGIAAAYARTGLRNAVTSEDFHGSVARP